MAIWGDRNRQNQPRPDATNYLVVVNRNGDIVERWQQWDSILNRPHQVYISPYDPQRHVWIVERGGGRGVPMSILKFTNDGKQLVMKLGDGGDPVPSLRSGVVSSQLPVQSFHGTCSSQL